MAIENVSGIGKEMTEQLAGNASDAVKSALSDILTKLKPVFIIILALAVIYILYKLIKLFFSWRRARREKLTYENTEKILEKLDEIKSLLTKRKPKEKEGKPRKEKKK